MNNKDAQSGSVAKEKKNQDIVWQESIHLLFKYDK